MCARGVPVVFPACAIADVICLPPEREKERGKKVKIVKGKKMSVKVCACVTMCNSPCVQTQKVELQPQRQYRERISMRGGSIERGTAKESDNSLCVGVRHTHTHTHSHSHTLIHTPEHSKDPQSTPTEDTEGKCSISSDKRRQASSPSTCSHTLAWEGERDGGKREGERGR